MGSFIPSGTPVAKQKVRLALGALVSFFIAPALPSLAGAHPRFTSLRMLMCMEVGVGLLLGFVSRIIFYILEFAGNLIASEMGMNWGSTLNPFSSSRSEAPGLMLFYPRAMMGLTGMLLVMALVPGLPMMPFLLLASGTGAMAYWLHKNRRELQPASGPGLMKAGKDGKPVPPGATSAAGASTGEKLETLLSLDALQIELGYGLVSLADTRKGGDLLERVTGVRRTFAQDMGLIIPPIRWRDNLQLGANEYRFLLKGNPIATGELMPGYWLAMNATNSKITLKGVPTTEPVFQLPATWITEQTHVFVGPPSAGKTTSLCKWLAQVVLLGGRSAHVWRLDGRTVNTAEALSVYAEILGVPVLRSGSPEPGRDPAEMLFVDLPGVEWQDSIAVAELKQRVQEFEGASVHLVLNAAYEVSLLLEQVQAFSALPIDDLIFTHLDEERRRGKLWNFVAGTNYALSFLTAGKNVPGCFRKASPDQLWPDIFPAKDESGGASAPGQPRWQSIC